MKWQIALIFILFFEIAHAQAIGVAPARLEFSGAENSIAERQFIIYNPSEEEMHFSVEGPFLFSEKSGIIEAGGSRKIIASANLQKDEASKITIVADSGFDGIALNTGVAIDAVISVLKEAKDMTRVVGPIISASIVAVGLGIFAAFGGLKKKQKVYM